MDNLNASLTDKTGKEIVAAIQALGGGVSHSGSSSDSPLMTVQAVMSYPGEGEDPYAAVSASSYWLPITFEELRTAVRAGKIILLTVPSVSSGDYDFDGGELYLFVNSYSDSNCTTMKFTNLNMETGDSANFHMLFFIKNDSDYPQNALPQTTPVV